MRGNDVESRKLQHALGLVERHAVGDAPAAVVAAQVELVEAEMAHHVELVFAHAAVGVIAVVGQAARLAAVAVAAQIGGHHGVILRQQRRDDMPVHVREWVAVQKQQGRAVAADDAVDFDLRVAGLDVELFEAFVHCELLAEKSDWICEPSKLPLPRHCSQAVQTVQSDKQPPMNAD